MLSTPASKATTNWISDPGKYSVGEIAARTTSALLRVEGGLKLGDRVVLGSPDPITRLIKDWTLDVRHTQPQPVLNVSSYRTREDQVPNKQVLNDVRQRLATVFATGPTVSLRSGAPDFSALVEPLVLSHSNSLFQHDYTLPPPTALAGPRWSLALPAGSAAALVEVFDRLRVPVSGPGGAALRTLDLTGGRSDPPTALFLIADERGDRLEANLTDPASSGIGSGGHLRDVRAILRTLRSLVTESSNGAPAAAVPAIESITSFLRSCEAYNEADDRTNRFVSLWDKDTPAAAISVRSGMQLPLGVTFSTRGHGLFDVLIDAERWLLVRQRTWSKGFRRAPKEKNRIYSARRPVILEEDGKLISYLRYAHVFSPDLSRFSTDSGDTTWFWELDLRSRASDDDMRTGSLLVSGLSIADGFLSYGAELASALRAFCWLLRKKDPDAEIRTVLLTVA